ncbi:MAG: hypothetical protein K2W96_19895 [Gemmataceae bacterium]|nr:hypothetical protein [Gemmataceae bacterium]
MRIEGKRIKKTRFLQTDRYVVAVEVELVFPLDDPGEPCYEAETVQLLREAKERLDRGDLDWLKSRGKVYAALAEAA